MNMEHRHLKRWHLVYYLRVFDNKTGELLGHLVDITLDGLMLICDKEVPAGKDYTLRMEYPNHEAKTTHSITFHAHSQWSNHDVNKQFYDTGFKLIHPSTEVVAIFRELIEELSF